MARVKEGLKDIKVAELILKSQRILHRMSGNIHYPVSNPPLSEVRSAADALRQAAASAIGRDHGQVAIRNRRMRELKQLLITLAADVQHQSNGDAKIILSSGFELRKKKTPTGPLPPARKVRTCFTPFPRAILLRWKHVPRKHAYLVEINPGNPNDESGWSSQGLATKSRMLIENLQTGKAYWLRVTAIGTSGVGAASNPARGLAW